MTCFAKENSKQDLCQECHKPVSPEKYVTQNGYLVMFCRDCKIEYEFGKAKPEDIFAIIKKM